MLKIVKDRSRLVKYLHELLKINIAFERLMFFFLVFFVLCHLTACLWITIARIEESGPMTWLSRGGYLEQENGDLYVTAMYFTVTTITTVGFGDISGGTMTEKLMCIVLMIIGVIGFSFATGSLSSLLSNYDASEAKLKEKLSTLNDLRGKYNLDPDLYDELRRTLKYDHNKNLKDTISFMDELPYKLKVKLAMQIHQDIYIHIKLFHNKPESFIAWIGP